MCSCTLEFMCVTKSLRKKSYSYSRLTLSVSEKERKLFELVSQSVSQTKKKNEYAKLNGGGRW